MTVLWSLLAPNNPYCILCTLEITFATVADLEEGENENFDFTFYLWVKASRVNTPRIWGMR